VTAYVLRRLIWAVVLLLAISLFAFVLFFIVPPETQQFGRGIAAQDVNLRDAYGIQAGSPIGEYGHFLWEIVRHGSLGESYSTRRDVVDMLAGALPVTISLVVGGAVLFMLIAVPIGVLSALRPRSFFDRFAMLIVLIGVSAHPVWIGLILSYFVGFRMGLTPIGGYCDLVDAPVNCGGPADWAHHMILPWITFAVLFAALYARMVRASVLETLDEDFVRTAAAKGAPRWIVLRSHVLRNAALPVVTMLGMDIGLAFGGAVFVEQVFGLPGMGRLAVTALPRRDLPVILGVVLTVTAAIVIFNLIVDLLYGWLDPRVRVGGSRADVEEARSARVPRGRTKPAPASSATASG
jgi:peptide/nickel transport system permease protein